MKRLISISVVVIFLISGAGCEKDSESNLSAARNLEGTWETSFPVIFYIQTDYCTGNLEDVAKEERMIIWEIETIDENNVFITVNFSSSNFEITNTNCGDDTGYVPDISMVFLSGSISSSALTVTEYGNETNVLGEFTFTSDLLQGTWSDSWCLAYCQMVYTETNQYKLIRQN